MPGTYTRPARFRERRTSRRPCASSRTVRAGGAHLTSIVPQREPFGSTGTFSARARLVGPRHLADREELIVGMVRAARGSVPHSSRSRQYQVGPQRPFSAIARSPGSRRRRGPCFLRVGCRRTSSRRTPPCRSSGRCWARAASSRASVRSPSGPGGLTACAASAAAWDPGTPCPPGSITERLEGVGVGAVRGASVTTGRAVAAVGVVLPPHATSARPGAAQDEG